VGAETRDTTLYFSPKPNDRLDGLSLHMRFRDMPVEVRLEESMLTVSAHADGSNRSIRIGFDERIREIKDGEGHTFALREPS
jgi:trehalose/maltose hydrolase-like predicted phosphorylase